MRTKTCRRLILFSLISAFPCSVDAVTLNQIDTFTSGVENWGNNAGTTTTQDNGLVGGSFLQVVSSGGGGSGSRLATFNSDQWAGDYLTVGITDFTFDALSDGDPLNLRFAFDGPGGWFVTSSILLGNSSSVTGLQSLAFSIAPEDVISIAGTGSGVYEDTFSDVTEFEILAAAGIPSEGGGGNLSGDQIATTLLIDNIQAIPEPSTLAITAIAFLGLTSRRRRS